MVAHNAGSAGGRRERRLRSCWRHEQMAIQMVLATVQHHLHGAPRSPTTATTTRDEVRAAQHPTGTQHTSSRQHAVLLDGRGEGACCPSRTSSFDLDTFLRDLDATKLEKEKKKEREWEEKVRRTPERIAAQEQTIVQKNHAVHGLGSSSASSTEQNFSPDVAHRLQAATQESLEAQGNDSSVERNWKPGDHFQEPLEPGGKAKERQRIPLHSSV